MINAFIWYFIGQVGCFFLSFQLAFLEVGCSILSYQVVLKTNVIDGAPYAILIFLVFLWKNLTTITSCLVPQKHEIKCKKKKIERKSKKKIKK